MTERFHLSVAEARALSERATVSVIDTTTHAVVATIPVGSRREAPGANALVMEDQHQMFLEGLADPGKRGVVERSREVHALHAGAAVRWRAWSP